MSRIIKFRYWDTKHNVMVEGPTVYDSADHLGLSLHDAGAYYTDEQMEGDDNHIYGGDDWIFIMNDFELLQFTGLTDKSGKEIFEDDIVKVVCHGEETVHRVIYGIDSDYPAFCLKPSLDLDSNDLQYCVVCVDSSIEVIGNAHSNPKLLKP